MNNEGLTQPKSSTAAAFEELTFGRRRERARETASVAFTRRQLRAILTELELAEERGSHLGPALDALREMLRAALQRMPY